MTMSRGVEVKELEIANINLDRNTNSYSGSVTAEGSARAETARLGAAAGGPGRAAPPPTPPAAEPPTLDSSSSYVQVVVQQRGAGERAARLPRASSPLRQVRQLYLLSAASVAANGESVGEGGAGAGAESLVLVPASLVLPARAAAPRAPPLHYREGAGVFGDEGYVHAPPDAGAAGDSQAPQKIQKSWRILNNINTDKLDISDNGPERVEVYYFEQGAGGAYLATSEAGRVTACERWARRSARAASAAFAPLPAAAHLLLAPPIALIIALERCALMAVRDLVTGTVQTASDYALKPALALVFNACVQPPLVLAANVARAVRSALRPLALAAADAAEPAARLLRALRLVTVHYDRAPDTRFVDDV